MTAAAGSPAPRAPCAGLGWTAALAIVLLGLGLRVGFELSTRADEGAVGVLASHLLGDERAYDDFARQSAEGSLDRDRAFYQEPLYAWLLGRVYALWPPSPLEAVRGAVPADRVHLAVIIVQHLLGVLVALGTAALGVRAVNRRTGILAGLLMAASGPAIFHEAMLLKAALSLVVIVLCLHLWLDLLEGAGLGRAAALGACLGLGILLRGNIYLLLAMVLASLVLRRSGRRPAHALMVGLVSLAVLSPATVHNLRRGDWVLTTYQSGSNAAIGQPAGGDASLGIIYAPLRAGRGDAAFEEADAVALAEAGAEKPLSSREVSSWWWATVARRVRAHPEAAATRVLRKVAHSFHGREVPDVKDWAFFAQAVPWLDTPLSNLWVLGPWALLGLAFLPWRKRPGLLVVRGGLLFITVSLALFYVMGRYRLSALPCLLLLAAAAIDSGLRLLQGGGWAVRGLVLLAAVGTPLGFAALPLASDVGGHHTSLANAASVERMAAEAASDPVIAERLQQRAIDFALQAALIAPLFPDAHAELIRAHSTSTAVLAPNPDAARLACWRLMLVLEARRTGTTLAPPPALEADLAREVLMLMSQPSEAGMDDFTAALRAFTARSLVPWLKPGALPSLDATTTLEVALRFADLALRLEPEEPVAHVQRGLVLKRMGRHGDALAAYGNALAAGYETAALFQNLGNVLLLMGRLEEAQVSFQSAARLGLAPDLVQRNDARLRAAQHP